MLTAERLEELLHYDPDTGVFTWRVTRGRTAKVGATAGRQNKGYIEVGIDGQRYGAHRLAFLYMTGEWPKEHVDHRDGNPANNAWANLREATRAQNMRNMRPHATSGLKGVYFQNNRWRAKISVDGEQVHLGYFDTAAEAKAIRDRAARDLHGEFARAS